MTEPFTVDYASQFASMLNLHEPLVGGQSADEGAIATAGVSAIIEDMDEEMFSATHLVETLHDQGVGDTSGVSGWEGNKQICQTIKDASQGVTEGTDAEYCRQVNKSLLQQCSY